MSIFEDEEDNNPFAGSDHLFASGIASSVGPASLYSGGNNHRDADDSASSPFAGSQLSSHSIVSDSAFFNDSALGPSSHIASPGASSVDAHEEPYQEEAHATYAPSYTNNHDESLALPKPARSGREDADGDVHTVTIPSPVKSINADSSPESWINYKHASKLLSDTDASIIDTDKQEEYERGLIDQANTTISSTNPLDFYSDTETSPSEALSKYPGIQIDIPYIIQLKDRKNKIVVVYIVKLKNLEARRRYSDFDKLRKTLTRIYPTFLLPSLPEKHSLKNYMKNPLNVQKSDVRFIEHRKRALRSFLNRIISYPNFKPEDNELPPIRFNEIFLKFLDPTVTNFSDSLKLPPITLLQKNSLLNDPLNPYKISPYHNLLPTPLPSSASSHDQAVKSYKALLERERKQVEELQIDASPKKRSNSILSTSSETNETTPNFSTVHRNDSATFLSEFDINKNIDIISFDDYQYFKSVEKYISMFSRSLRPIIDSESRLHHTFEDLIRNLSKLGAYFNAFSLEYNFTMTFQPDFKVPHNDKTFSKSKVLDNEAPSVPDDDIQNLRHNLALSQNKDFEQFYTLSSAIEKVGQSIDNEFINIEMLEHSLMTSFSEPLIEINSILKNLLTEVMRFKKLKDLQYLSINKRLREKRRFLQTYLDIDNKYQRLEQVLKSNSHESATMKQAYQRLEFQKQQQFIKEQQQVFRNQAYNNMNHNSFDNSQSSDINGIILNEDSMSLVRLSGNSYHWLSLFTGKANSPESMTRSQRSQEIKKLKKEIVTLQHLAAIAANDVKRVSMALKQNVKNLAQFLRIEITKLNLKFSKIFLKFLQENLSHWVQVNEYINTNIYDLKFNIKYDSRIPRYVRYPNEDLYKRQELANNNFVVLNDTSDNDKTETKLTDSYLDEQIANHNSRVTASTPAAELNGKNSVLNGLVNFEFDEEEEEKATSSDHGGESVNRDSTFGESNYEDEEDNPHNSEDDDDSVADFNTQGFGFDNSGDSDSARSLDRTL